jgi:hypothetical protein
MKRHAGEQDYVDELFNNASDRHEDLRRCPVTGGSFTKGDNLRPIKDRARRALSAAESFDQTGPIEYYLPLTYQAREALKARLDEGYIVSLFASSLKSAEWRCELHPDYPEYAAGILALPELGQRILKTDPSLAKRYPPAVLSGLKPAGYYEISKRRAGRKSKLMDNIIAY